MRAYKPRQGDNVPTDGAATTEHAWVCEVSELRNRDGNNIDLFGFVVDRKEFCHEPHRLHCWADRYRTRRAFLLGPPVEERPMKDPRERRITARAFELWQDEGCLDGRSLGHWLKAEKEIDDEIAGEAVRSDDQAEPTGGGLFEAFDDAGTEALIYATTRRSPTATDSSVETRYFLDAANGPELYMHPDKRLRKMRPGEGEGEGERRAWTLRK